MIRFALRCDKEHRFESWFGSGDDYERLRGQGLISCAVCGSGAVEKDLMAPHIGTGAGPRDAAPSGPPAPPSLSAPASPAEKALSELRAKIEARSENVGRDFAAEARRIHAGEAPARPIIGEARVPEARALVEEGIAVLPLPWSNRKTN